MFSWNFQKQIKRERELERERGRLVLCFTNYLSTVNGLIMKSLQVFKIKGNKAKTNVNEHFIPGAAKLLDLK